MTRTSLLLSAAAVLLLACAVAQQQPHPGDLGFTDTPMLPNMPWHVHDPARPHPRIVTPAETPGAPPSDAIVLFDGKDLSQWTQDGRGAQKGKLVDAQWKLGDGYFEVVRDTGNLRTREAIGVGENENRRLSDIIEAGHAYGWHSFEQSLIKAYEDDLITEETAILYCINKSQMRQRVDIVNKRRETAPAASTLKMKVEERPPMPPPPPEPLLPPPPPEAVESAG